MRSRIARSAQSSLGPGTLLPNGVEIVTVVNVLSSVGICWNEPTHAAYF